MSITTDEIASQPEMWTRALDQVEHARELFAAAGESILVIGCGTSAYIAESFAYLREAAGLGTTDAAYASEPYAWRGWDRVVAITRSGTTTEVVAALEALPAGVRRIVVTGRRDAASGRVEVVKGLAADAQILAVRFDNLKEGAPAKVVAQRSLANAASGASAPAGSSPSASASAAPVSRS